VTTPALPVPASPEPDQPHVSKTEPPFDPTSWSGALITMAVLAAVLWVIEGINEGGNYNLQQYGLRPRDLDGLVGIVTAPFLHTGYGGVLADTAPFIGIGWVVLLSGIRPFLLTSAIILVVGGLATWLVAPTGILVGASGLILGWLGYLLGRAYFSRRFVWIMVAVGALFFFGALLGNLLPSVDSQGSWQGHIAGFAAGVLAAWVLHPRSPGVSRREPLS
jgi:membrane associated rhomboid family serine protease